MRWLQRQFNARNILVAPETVASYATRQLLIFLLSGFWFSSLFVKANLMFAHKSIYTRRPARSRSRLGKFTSSHIFTIGFHSLDCYDHIRLQSLTLAITMLYYLFNSIPNWIWGFVQKMINSFDLFALTIIVLLLGAFHHPCFYLKSVLCKRAF